MPRGSRSSSRSANNFGGIFSKKTSQPAGGQSSTSGIEKKAKPLVPSNSSQSPAPLQQSSASSTGGLMGTVVQGAAFGAGASMGSSAINAVGNALTSDSKKETQEGVNASPVNDSDCAFFYRDLQKCIDDSGNLESCSSFLDYYYRCLGTTRD